MKAKFAPNFTKFDKNLNLQREDVLIYLGTYFPRSFAETYSIFNNIFQNEVINKTKSNKTEINILDIGSGTGGNLSGLLLSLLENISQTTNINIVAIDGNQYALKLLKRVVFQLQLRYKLKLNLSCYYITFDTITDLYQKTKQFFVSNFDFIISSKIINEIIIKDMNSYYNFYSCFGKYLNEEGILLLLDVTTKIENNYMPILLNEQTNSFVQNNTEYKTLIPTSCAEFDVICNKKCFSNNFFTITHSKKKNDKTKVAYRVIGRKSFVEKEGV